MKSLTVVKAWITDIAKVPSEQSSNTSCSNTVHVLLHEHGVPGL